MAVLKSILLIVYLFPFGSSGQFRIVGLLNVDESKSDGNRLAAYQSNAQGRGFSVDEGLKKFLIRPKNIIRVHLIDDVNQSDIIPETDNILMLRTHKPKVQQNNETASRKPPKSDKTINPTKRSPYQQIVRRTYKNNYAQRLNSVLPDTANRSPAHNPVRSKYRKDTKRNQYKSRCRCERISNCPRIQISVSRCEPNYFLCCF